MTYLEACESWLGHGECVCWELPVPNYRFTCFLISCKVGDVGNMRVLPRVWGAPKAQEYPGP